MKVLITLMKTGILIGRDSWSSILRIVSSWSELASSSVSKFEVVIGVCSKREIRTAQLVFHKAKFAQYATAKGNLKVLVWDYLFIMKWWLPFILVSECINSLNYLLDLCANKALCDLMGKIPNMHFNINDLSVFSVPLCSPRTTDECNSVSSRGHPSCWITHNRNPRGLAFWRERVFIDNPLFMLDFNQQVMGRIIWILHPASFT